MALLRNDQASIVRGRYGKDTIPAGLCAVAVLAEAAVLLSGAVAAKYYTVTAYTNSNTSYTDCFAFTGGFKGGKLAVGGLPASISIAGCAFGEGRKHLLF